MAFRLDTAVATLQNVMDALARSWRVLDPAARQGVAALLHRHGPSIAIADPVNVASRAVVLLDALWDMRRLLSNEANQCLKAGQGATPRGIVGVAPEARQRLLDSMVKVVDFRAFRDSSQLAGELDALIGAHQERLSDEERAEWHRLAERRRRGGNADAYLRQVESLLGAYGSVCSLLDQGKTWWVPHLRMIRVDPQVPDGSDAPGSARLTTREAGKERMPAVVARHAAATSAANDKIVVRYANVHFPATVLLSQRMIPLVLYVAEQYWDAGGRVSRDGARLILRVGDLTLILHADGFQVVKSIGGVSPAGGMLEARTVAVTPGCDCEPVVFFLNPSSLGKKRISIDVYQFGRNLATLAFDTVVAQRATARDLAPVSVAPVPLVSPAERAQAVDLELRVTLSGDRRTLAYSLHSPAGSDYNHRPAGEVVLGMDPVEVLRRTLDRLSELARRPRETRSPADTRRAEQEIADIGHNLYQELFPPALKQEYQRIREKFAGRSLLITSDEPWIPWEMVKPVAYTTGGSLLYDDPHFCEMFTVARWLAGRGPVDRVPFKSGALVVPLGNLPAVREELDYFTRVHRRHWSVNLGDSLSTVSAVEDAFRAGAHQMFHFACHGSFDMDDPDESRLRLSDGFLRPSQIVGDKQAGLLRARPFVFINACHSGAAGFTMTRLGGWAQRFVNAGCSAFIGSLWEIHDGLAARFAMEFYNRAWGLNGQQPMCVGRAVQEARLIIKQLDPANPTWLAYALYADPNAIIQMGER